MPNPYLQNQREPAPSQRELRRQLRRIEPGVAIAGFTIGEHLADGNVSRVYRAESDGRPYVFKALIPRLLPRLGYRLFHQEGHGYRRRSGLLACYWRRRLVSRLMPLLCPDVEVCDAVALSIPYHGFFSPFVSDPPARTDDEIARVSARMHALAARFRELGLPTWSFDPSYPFWSSRRQNVRIAGDRLRIIDLEGGIPVPTANGGWDLDHVDFDRIDALLASAGHQLSADRAAELVEALEECRKHTRAWHSAENRALFRLQHRSDLSVTLDALHADGHVGGAERDRLRRDIGNLDVRYIVFHLAVHVAFGLTVGVFTGVLPLGMVPRGLWTIGNRVYHELRRNRHRAVIHSLRVLLWSCIPIPGINYCGYLTSLKRINPLLPCLLYAHFLRITRSVSLTEHLARCSRLHARLVAALFIPPGKRSRFRR